MTHFFNRMIRLSQPCSLHRCPTVDTPIPDLAFFSVMSCLLAMLIVGFPTEPVHAQLTNVVVNDPTGEVCFSNGCTQQQPTIDTSDGTNLYAAWNDAAGFSNPSQGFTGWGVSTDGGTTWTDGGGLPQGGGQVEGDPSVAVCTDPTVVYMANWWTPPEGGRMLQCIPEPWPRAS